MSMSALTVLSRAAATAALVGAAAGCEASARTHPPPSAALSPSSPSSAVPDAADVIVRGTYTFRIKADLDRGCGWPVTAFAWPVSVQVTSYMQPGSTIGWIVFPPVSSGSPNRWSISGGPTGTQLAPGDGTPGPAAAAYDVTVAEGRWVGVAASPARDGRGEITSGTATGARLTLVLPHSDRRWECRSEVRWSLLARYGDRD